MNKQTFVIRTKDDALDMVDTIVNLPLETPISVEIKEHKLKRTLTQNALLHQWFDEIAVQRMDKGWEPPEVMKDNGKPFKPAELIKEYFKNRFLPTIEIAITDDYTVIRPKSTSDLDTGECSNFMMMVEADCSEHGIRLTIPKNSQYYKLQQKQGNKI